MTGPSAAPDPTAAADRTLGRLLSDLSEQVSRLVRAEIELAKAEITGRAKQAGLGAGLLVAAGVLALYVLGALIATAILGLATVLPAWLAALIVTLVLILVTAVLGGIGAKQVQRANPPQPVRATEQARLTVEALKGAVSGGNH
ncbi:phage holin family protein [Cellulomonas soli]